MFMVEKPNHFYGSDEIDEETNMLLQIIQPMMSNMLGGLGQNLHFICFKSQSEGKRMADPRSNGTLSVKMFDESYLFNFPLASLLPPKFCPVDDASMKGTWTYCPFHGKELKASNK